MFVFMHVPNEHRRSTSQSVKVMQQSFVKEQLFKLFSLEINKEFCLHFVSLGAVFLCRVCTISILLQMTELQVT